MTDEEVTNAAIKPVRAEVRFRPVNEMADRVNNVIDAVLEHIAFQNERHNRLARPMPEDHARLTNMVAKLKALKTA